MRRKHLLASCTQARRNNGAGALSGAWPFAAFRAALLKGLDGLLPARQLAK